MCRWPTLGEGVNNPVSERGTASGDAVLGGVGHRRVAQRD